jgi:hypothetical protein
MHLATRHIKKQICIFTDITPSIVTLQFMMEFGAFSYLNPPFTNHFFVFKYAPTSWTWQQIEDSWKITHMTEDASIPSFTLPKCHLLRNNCSYNSDPHNSHITTVSQEYRLSHCNLCSSGHMCCTLVLHWLSHCQFGRLHVFLSWLLSRRLTLAASSR